MSIYSATAKKRTSVSYGSGGGSSGGSSGSSSGRRPIDYSSIGGGSSGSSGGSSGAASSGGGSSGGSGNSNYYVSNPDNTMMSTGTPTSPGRVAANSYESGKVTTEKDAYGGEYKTSPNGQVSYHDKDGNVTILHSNNNKELIGHTFYSDGTSTMDKPVEKADPSAAYSYTYKGEYDNVGKDAYSMQVDALQTAMNNNREALEAAYDESELALNDAIADAQRQAYVNQQRSMKAMPQLMAAAGYSGGVTESNAANIMNEYQNALIDLDRSKAQELARLQANLANGIAESDTQYQIQLANALQAAQQFEAQQEAQRQQLAMQQRAAALEEERYRDQLALQQAELQLQRDRFNNGNNADSADELTTGQILNLWNGGKVNDEYARKMLGLGVESVPNSPTITNSNSSAGRWVAVQGIGRISAEELNNGIANGSIRARDNGNGSITYVYVG